MLTATTLQTLILAVHKERKTEDKGCARAVQVVLKEFGVDQEWEVPLRALCTGAQAYQVIRWAKEETR